MAQIHLRIALQPKQRLFDAAIEKYKVTFFGGAKGGGKSAGLRRIMLKRRFQYPKTTGTIFRKTYPELEANHIRPLFKDYPELRSYYNAAQRVLTLPNLSTLEFRYCNSYKDLELQQGQDINDLAIDEVGQWPEDWFQTLRGSNRSSVPGYKSKIMLTGNPGGLGHKWLKRLFIDRQFNQRENSDDYYFIQSRVYDNAALMENDPDYLRNLQAEPNETLRRAFLDGDWNIWAGQFFSEFRREIHASIPSSFIREIEPSWTRFGAYDHGYFHPAMFGEFVVDPDGNLYLINEWGDRNKRPDEIAAAIHGLTDVSKLDYIVGGADLWSKQRDGGRTLFEQFLTLPKNKIVFTKAKTDRIQGAAELRKLLAWERMGAGMKGPRFFVLEHCHRSIDCITRMVHDPKRPEDVLKVDATEIDTWAGDDPYDMIRYGVMSRFSVPDRIYSAEEVAANFVELTREQRLQGWKDKRKRQLAHKKKFGSRDSVLGI